MRSHSMRSLLSQITNAQHSHILDITNHSALRRVSREDVALQMGEEQFQRIGDEVLIVTAYPHKAAINSTKQAALGLSQRVHDEHINLTHVADDADAERQEQGYAKRLARVDTAGNCAV